MMASTLSVEQKKQMKSLLRQFQDAFHRKTQQRKCKLNVKHKINTGIHPAVSQRPYWVSSAERCVINDEAKHHLTVRKPMIISGHTEIKVLGHLVSGKGVKPNPDKLEAVNSFPTPKKIHDLLKEDSKFHWEKAQEDSFWDLKSALTSPPVLALYDENAPTELHTDASGNGIGAVLVQQQDGKERVIAYASRTLTKAKKNYSTTEQECLATIWAITKFHPYLFGKCFNIITDHHSLCWGEKHADCLLQNPIPIIPEIESLAAISDLATEQLDDPSLAAFIKACEQSPDLSSAGFSIVNNVLSLPTAGAPEVAKFFVEEIILTHGAPRTITDRGTVFQSNLVAEINNQYKVVHRKTTAYHPQTNGLTERFNKTLADMLDMYVDI
ncbi:retrovirus-related Pol polyprotein from transposon 412 [Trichonephila clavipes]|nr:retrovirus-related Pol polyprotein from transposon 412 [Trichonephila clavipes]